mmetsp:Transcript_23942/g.71826  ORF Transcript_23942/g.71826 Transcript_23942/m.71826 type:complete len:228 (+) Transcript_23942:268-951(+)
MLARLPIGGFASRYAAAYERSPTGVAVSTGLIVKTASDAFAQTVVEGRPEIDMRRTAAISVFAASVGGYGNYLFLREASKLLTRFKGPKAPLMAAAADVLCFCPLIYLPSYTLLMGASAGASLKDIERQLWASYGPASLSCVAVLGPAQVINFAYVPYGLRLPFMLSAAFVYNAALGSINLRVQNRAGAPAPAEAPRRTWTPMHLPSRDLLAAAREPRHQLAGYGLF